MKTGTCWHSTGIRRGGWNHKNEGCHFYHLDEQNSTAYITGMEGGIGNRYQYDAFGVITDRQKGFDNRILYTGQQYDPITEQYYLRARYYNPAVGRFLQEDVYRGDGLNLYAYCANNPVIYYDPSGYARGRRKNSTTNTSPNIDYGSINLNSRIFLSLHIKFPNLSVFVDYVD